VKWSQGCGWEVACIGPAYHALNGVWEGKTPAEAERLIASGRARLDPSADHARAVGPNKVSIILLPTDPGSWFRAYPALSMGIRVFVDSKRSPSSRYASAWPYALAGDCDSYARELGRRGFFMASPDAYSAAMLVPPPRVDGLACVRRSRPAPFHRPRRSPPARGSASRRACSMCAQTRRRLPQSSRRSKRAPSSRSRARASATGSRYVSASP
jgi:hypothetical protein